MEVLQMLCHKAEPIPQVLAFHAPSLWDLGR